MSRSCKTCKHQGLISSSVPCKECKGWSGNKALKWEPKKEDAIDKCGTCGFGRIPGATKKKEFPCTDKLMKDSVHKNIQCPHWVKRENNNTSIKDKEMKNKVMKMYVQAVKDDVIVDTTVSRKFIVDNDTSDADAKVAFSHEHSDLYDKMKELGTPQVVIVPFPSN